MNMLEFAQAVRELIELGEETALCYASERVRQNYDLPRPCGLEHNFDGRVRELAEEYGGTPSNMFTWPKTPEGKAARLAVCDHIIKENEHGN